MAENDPPPPQPGLTRGKLPRSKTLADAEVTEVSKRTTTSGPPPAKSKTWAIKARLTMPMRSSSWSLGTSKRANSNKSIAGSIDDMSIKGGAVPPSVPKVIKSIIVEELGARAGFTIFGPTSLFSGSVMTNALKCIENASITVTFQGTSHSKGFASTFMNVPQKLWQGALEPGLKQVLFAFRFPRINLPPSSRTPSIRYTFIATLRYGENQQYTLYSPPAEVQFCPCVDPFVFSTSLPPAQGELAGIPPRQQSATEVAEYREHTQGPIVAQFDTHIPCINFLPGDVVSIDLKFAHIKGKDMPKIVTVNIEETRRLVVDGSDGHSEFRSSPEITRSIKTQVIPFEWGPNPKKGSNTGETKTPVINIKSVEEVNTDPNNQLNNHTVLDPQKYRTIAQTLQLQLPEYEKFITTDYIPTSSLPLNGTPPPEFGENSTEERPQTSSNMDPYLVPEVMLHSGKGMRMIVSHRLHLSVQLHSARIALKKPTIHMYCNINLGNKNPKDSRRSRPSIVPTPLSPTLDVPIIGAPIATKKRSASTNTQISFVLTTAEEVDGEIEEIDTKSLLSVGSDKGKTPVYKLPSHRKESLDGSGLAVVDNPGATLGSGYAIGATLCEMPESPLWMDVKTPKEEREEHIAFKTLAETKERPYFFRYDFEDPFPA